MPKDDGSLTPEEVAAAAAAAATTATRNANGVVVNRVSVKVPPFWPERPEIWFAQVEAQFGIAGIVTDLTKFNTVVAAIESNVLSQISDAILTPPENGKYENLKKCMIERFCDSEQKKMQKLLSDIELGDRRPTQLLSELSDLAKDRVSDDFLKSLWLQRLPGHVRAILQASNASLTELAKLADKILEVSDYRQVCSVETVQSGATISEINQRMARLEKNFEQLFQKQRRRSSSSRSTHRNAQAGTTTNTSDAEQCWYHRKFGDKARTCRKPCKFNSDSKN